MKIMALDDEKGALKVLVRTIQQVAEDAEITDFCDPEEALEWFPENEVDIVFLDIQMPEISGPEMAAKLKAMKPDLKVVFVTGFLEGENDDAAEIADGFVMKPVTRKDIVKVLGF